MATVPSTSTAGTVLTLLNALLGVADIADPALGVPIAVISKLLSGIAAGAPAAIALINDFKSGATTQADLAASILAYQATDDQLAADLKADGAS